MYDIIGRLSYYKKVFWCFWFDVRHFRGYLLSFIKLSDKDKDNSFFVYSLFILYLQLT